MHFASFTAFDNDTDARALGLSNKVMVHTPVASSELTATRDPG